MARFTLPRQQVSDALGAPLPGAKLYFFASGTSTPQATYSDAALSVANANPLVADATGTFGDIFLIQNSDYRVRLDTAGGVTLWTADSVSDRPGFFDGAGNLPMGGKRVTGLGAPAAAGDAVRVNAAIKVPKVNIPDDALPAQLVTMGDGIWQATFSLTTTRTEFFQIAVPAGCRRIFGVGRCILQAQNLQETVAIEVVLKNSGGAEDSRRTIARAIVTNTGSGPTFGCPAGSFRWDFAAGSALSGYTLRFEGLRGSNNASANVVISEYAANVLFVVE